MQVKAIKCVRLALHWVATETSKATIYFAMAMVTAGCASTTVNLSVQGLSDSELSLVNSDCDSTCERKLESIFAPTSDAAMPYLVSTVILLAIDSKFGTTTFYDRRGSYTDMWAGNYSIKIDPGKHTALAKPDYHKASGSVEREFEFLTERGHEYFLGQILIASSGVYNYSYKWTPLVYDKMDQKVIYPIGEVQWQGQNIKAMPVVNPWPM